MTAKKKKKGTLGPVGLKKKKQTIQTYWYSEVNLRWTGKQQHYSTEQRNYTESQKKRPMFRGDSTPLLQGQKDHVDRGPSPKIFSQGMQLVICTISFTV